MSDRPLRLGIVGFGRLVRRYYLPALRMLPGVQLVAVADPLAECRTTAVARLPGVRVHADHRIMLEREELDGLLVASPPSTHLAVWRDGARRDVAVFLEKPFVLSAQLGEIERLEASPRLMFDFNRRFWPAYRRVADLVQRGDLGRPVEADFALHLDVLAWCTVTPHRLSTTEGGVLHDLGSQAIDLAAYLLGAEPVSVTAEMQSRRWREDHVRLRVVFPDGSIVRCDLAYERRTREHLVVRGPMAGVRLDDPNMAPHLETDGRFGARCLDAAVFCSRVLRPARAFGRASIGSALGEFVHALRGERPFSPGFAEGVQNARWVAAAAGVARREVTV